MLLRIAPRADESAALAFEDVASGLDAGLPPAALGGDATQGERMLHDLFARRRIRLDVVEALVMTAAWKAGRAPLLLRQLAEQRRARATFARGFISSCRYPLVLFVMAILVSSVIGKVAQSSAVTPVAIGGALLLAIGMVLCLRGLEHGRRSWLALPWLGTWARDLAELPYLEVLRALYGAGVPMLAAHPQAVAACPVAAVRDDLQRADVVLQNGRPLSEALAEAGALHSETRQLLAGGDRTGGLEDALGRALTRRRDVATRRTAAIGRGLGALVYLCAAGLAIYVIASFYSGYARMLKGH